MELSARGLDNDTRGWIMCVVSGIACIFGASIVCLDLIVRLFPGKRSFRIQESNIFLACSLSLSFGVMMFSALYSMLPESKDYLERDAWADQPAGFVVMGCFIGGFLGIQIVSRLLHQHMPSHVVDCDHTHEGANPQGSFSSNHSRRQSRVSRARRRLSRPRSSHSHAKLDAHQAAENGMALACESTTLLPPSVDTDGKRHGKPSRRHASTRADGMSQRPTSSLLASRSRATTTDLEAGARRPSMYEVQKRVMSFVRDTKCNCDEEGSCYGYTDPCGQECFKHLSTRSQSGPRHAATLRTTTGLFHSHSGSVFHAGHGHDDPDTPISPRFRTSSATSREAPFHQTEEETHGHDEHDSSCSSVEEGDAETSQHHHHVPTNAFLSIGLQTSIAIALHKFPEGFITYATNHANPTLGFNVFMALFVHNISEGLAMCLPLYMALGSRWRAIAWSAVLGGLSQPLGAGAAALWFKVAQRSNMTPNALVYACLFAVTSGIMVSVALQLFVEGLSLNHNRNLCIFFGFLGMAVLGLSNALLAAH
ncbi:vacuolar Zn-iron permease [Metarhizium album ARSEF 1941]|uniref:Vacuolar Zn-iron permease n=1 Tax=Metarhizium album (strain ARSEF 1941) TaxID=1081103 RepID=A0A0B2X1U0_METAS|nr:vacuolar Zn-iron permease [Metarhizium album ARSEF 1941]KHN99667.1 vacuolar Zn-iron permease [Metarhizium album ARSEF 1941]